MSDNLALTEGCFFIKKKKKRERVAGQSQPEHILLLPTIRGLCSSEWESEQGCIVSETQREVLLVGARCSCCQAVQTQLRCCDIDTFRHNQSF